MMIKIRKLSGELQYPHQGVQEVDVISEVSQPHERAVAQRLCCNCGSARLLNGHQDQC